ncbi:hypothetical protein K0817_009295 [Microbacterium sp. HD4P20]|uniref:hypothetical protein n=1 Tax=Microbacterium sp. HD4P20 TaxID=2864874 RepID=UPI001C643D93|nr:hypothetical protein [Microbacterium sp. HD4P20]MCP2636758.1 hypothetical protein [Microbacterium sp. HD4P20]
MTQDPGLASAVAIATIIAAIATTLSAIVIAVQAWYTRKAVVASEESTVVAERALQETQIARIESGVPHLTVTTPGYVDATKLSAAIPGSWQKRAVASTETFVLPRDADLQLSLRHSATLLNDGPGTAMIRARGTDGGSAYVLAEPVPPGESHEFVLTVTHTVSEWVALLEPEDAAAKPLRYPVSARFWLTYTGPRDADVTETHQIVIRGSALLAVDGANGTWRAETSEDFGTTLGAQVLPATRTYWRSRSANDKFDV